VVRGSGSLGCRNTELPETPTLQSGAQAVLSSQDEWDSTGATTFSPGYVPTSAQHPPPPQQPLLAPGSWSPAAPPARPAVPG